MLNFGISERRHNKKGSADDLMPSTGGSLRECTTIYEHARRWKNAYKNHTGMYRMQTAQL